MLKILAILFSFAALCISIACSVAENAASKPLPDPTPVAAATPNTGNVVETAVFAGGCFWGVDAVYKHVKGVTDVKSGYAGGAAKSSEYHRDSERDNGQAETVRVKYTNQHVI